MLWISAYFLTMFDVRCRHWIVFAVSCYHVVALEHGYIYVGSIKWHRYLFVLCVKVKVKQSIKYIHSCHQIRMQNKLKKLVTMWVVPVKKIDVMYWGVLTQGSVQGWFRVGFRLVNGCMWGLARAVIVALAITIVNPWALGATCVCPSQPIC